MLYDGWYKRGFMGVLGLLIKEVFVVLNCLNFEW